MSRKLQQGPNQARHLVPYPYHDSLPKHLLIRIFQRSFIRAHPGLRMKASRNEADDDAENFPAPANLLPQKRAHTGLTKASMSDGKLLEAFWREMAVIWGEKNTQYGTDLKSEGWTVCVHVHIHSFPRYSCPMTVTVLFRSIRV
jgi:hypothetical protein